MRRQQQASFANPVLLGAVTVLVAIVAVFLAYNANNGLPFVPTRTLNVILPDGSALVDGNDVREGGFRIGIVSDMKPVRCSTGTCAEATLQLNTQNGHVPIDSTATIRPRSALGLKYVDLAFGHSTKVFPDGGTLPVTQTAIPVQFDDINKIFDARTRPAVDKNLVGFGDTLAARGSSLNDTIASLPNLFKNLQPVAQYLSDPRTQLTRFFGALNGFFSTVSPVATTNARLFGDQATTFQAISHSASDLEATIQKSPPTLDVGTRSLHYQQPFLVDFATFNRDLAPATAALGQALPQIDPALEAGYRVLPRTPSANAKLQRVLSALQNLAQAPGTNIALNGLTDTVGTLNPVIRYLGPYVTVCNSFNWMWEEFQDLVSEQTSFGMAQRALIQFTNHQTNNVGDQGATAPANGYNMSNPEDQFWAAQNGGADAEYTHGGGYSGAIDTQGNADCEAGQHGYQLQLNSLDNQTPIRDLVSEAHVPGNQGPVWYGLSHTPPGETFSREPTTGPALPRYPNGNN